MNIRVANIKDFPTVFSLVETVIEDMNRQKIDQWDDIYPNEEVLKSDIENNSLYVIEKADKITGITVLNEHQEAEYKNIIWKYSGGNVLVVHRLSVHPDFQGQGIARELMKFAEHYAEENRYDLIRLDAFKNNQNAVSLYEKAGYHLAGTVTFRKGEFYCFEKEIKAKH